MGEPRPGAHPAGGWSLEGVPVKIFQIIIYICSLEAPVCLPETAEALVYGPSVTTREACHELALQVLKETRPAFPGTTASFLCRRALESAS